MADGRVRFESRPVRTGGTVRGRVLLVPGAGYSVDNPLLYWAATALEEDGWQINAIRWDVSGLDGDAAAFVEATIDQLARQSPLAASTVVVAKSLGTFAAPWAAVHDIPAVWLTPLLTEPTIVEAIEGTTAPTLLIGGTRDSWWRALPSRPNVSVIEIEGADHSLQRDRWADSIAVVTDVTRAVQTFCADI
jgi:pimeloyl-ACP methyl ester carboxylesterase